MGGWGGHGGGAGGFDTATVKSGSVRELGSSSTANPRLHAELMKTKRLTDQSSLNLPVTAA